MEPPIAPMPRLSGVPRVNGGPCFALQFQHRRARPRSNRVLSLLFKNHLQCSHGAEALWTTRQAGELCSVQLTQSTLGRRVMLWWISPFLKINYKSYWVIPLRKCGGTHSWGGIENRSVLPHRHGPRSGIANVGSPFENARLPAGTTIVKPKPILEPTKPPPSLRLQVPQTSTRQPDSQTPSHPKSKAKQSHATSMYPFIHIHISISESNQTTHPSREDGTVAGTGAKRHWIYICIYTYVCCFPYKHKSK